MLYGHFCHRIYVQLSRLTRATSLHLLGEKNVLSLVQPKNIRPLCYVLFYSIHIHNICEFLSLAVLDLSAQT